MTVDILLVIGRESSEIPGVLLTELDSKIQLFNKDFLCKCNFPINIDLATDYKEYK